MPICSGMACQLPKNDEIEDAVLEVEEDIGKLRQTIVMKTLVNRDIQVHQKLSNKEGWKPQKEYSVCWNKSCKLVY